jgi:hypothetical protein
MGRRTEAMAEKAARGELTYAEMQYAFAKLLADLALREGDTPPPREVKQPNAPLLNQDEIDTKKLGE